MAKLYDLAAIYGPSNPKCVKLMISNVFENENRYVADFKETVDTMIALLKKLFSTSIKVTDMVSGSVIYNQSRAEQDRIIKNLLLDFVEITCNLELTCQYFPEQLLDNLRNTSLPLFMANLHCIMKGPAKQFWLQGSLIKGQLEVLRKSLVRVSLNMCIKIFDTAILRHIG
jgi:hypothetical protein